MDSNTDTKDYENWLSDISFPDTDGDIKQYGDWLSDVSFGKTHAVKKGAVTIGNTRESTVFDAVAGRIGRGLPPLYDLSRASPRTAAYLRKASRSRRANATPAKPSTADEVLFENSLAPERYEEHDIYFANERELPHGGQRTLPQSDSLKAIHEHSSFFYRAMEDRPSTSAQGRDLRSPDFQSMDETALIAFGILLEESAKEVLGRSGHNVFVVNENSDSEREDAAAPEMSPASASPPLKLEVKTEVGTKIEDGDVVDMSQASPWNEESGPSGSSRKKKKRKVGGLQSLGSRDRRLTKGFKTR